MCVGGNGKNYLKKIKCGRNASAYHNGLLLSLMPIVQCVTRVSACVAGDGGLCFIGAH